jgi:L-seryl-tRNA(Ser) seleniumtransferase
VREPSPAARRALPPAHEILATDAARALVAERGRPAVTAALRAVLDGLRAAVLAGALPADRAALRAEAVARLHHQVLAERPAGLRRVINAAGVVLHTNLGRAPLGESTLAAVAAACRGYAAVEYDLARGERGHRDALLAPLANAVLGGDDAVVVNNCAAAVLLAATALAAGREVVVSRGELVEIGGGFRIPDVIAACGARLVEVGTTNKTRAADYARALGPDTGAILVVHRSNFALVGFTAQATLPELAALARARGVPLLVDLGSGAGGDTHALGLTAREPLARECVAAGADLVMVSGDKLLGGPQAGLVVGGAAWVALLRAHPLMRALRPGRLVLAALAETLRAHAEGRAARDVPAVALLARPPAAVRALAEALLAALTAAGLPDEVNLALRPTEARVGGGTLPLEALPSWAVRVGGVAPDPLAAALRGGEPPVVGRVLDGALHLDVRSVLAGEVTDLAAAVAAALHKSVATVGRPAHATGA